MTGNPSTNGAGPQKRAETLSRRCTAKTRSGNPCGASPLKGRDVCLAHADAKTRESTGFVAVNGKAGRPRKPRAVDVFRQKLEAEVEEWWQVLIEARSAERGVVVGDGEHARVEYVEDHPTRLKAFKEAMDRVYGKPMQYVDVTGRADESEIDREISELLAEMDSLDPDRSAVAQANAAE